MTREHKLALILGFSVIMIVGVLLGDHFSRARQAQVGSEVASATNDAISVPRDSGLQPLPPTVVQTSLVSPAGPELAPELTTPSQPEPTEIRMGAPQGDGGVATRPGSKLSVPPAISTDVIEIPRGSGESGTAPKDVAKPGLPTSRGQERRYVVEEGDTLYQIANSQYSDGSLHKALADYNKDRVGKGGALRLGVTLRIPPKDVLTGKAVLGPEGTKITDPINPPAAPAGGSGAKTPSKSTHTGPIAELHDAPGSPTLGTPGKPSAARSYTIKAGDTLGKIALANLGTSKRWSEIASLNKLDADSELKVGDTLKLPPR